MYNFDQVIKRNGSGSTKWDRYQKTAGLADIIPLWVADMDFACLKEVTEALKERAKHPIYGYTDAQADFYAAIIVWEKSRHNVEIKREEIIPITGVVYGFYSLIELLVAQDEKVIVQDPVYPPFFNTPAYLAREVVYNPLIKENGTYRMDLQGFAAKVAADPQIRLLLLCNPHNPTGQCYDKETLNALFEICHKYQLWVIADEIHADILMPGARQCYALNCDEKYWDRLIVLTSPTKTFNLAGLKVAYALIKNPQLQKEFALKAKASGLASINLFGLTALTAAYNYGDQWHKECCAYIYENFKYLKAYLTLNWPGASFKVPEATYLAWVDLHALSLPNDYVERLKNEGRVEVKAGLDFGKDCAQYVRINVACPRAILKEGLERMTAWFKANHCFR